MSDQTKVEPLSMAEELADVPGEAMGDASILDELPIVPDAFSVSTENEANWVVLKITQARERAARAKAFATREIARAEKEEAFFLSRFGCQLEAFARQQLATGNRKSIPLPAGTLAFRTAPERLCVDDEQAAIAWAKSNAPSAVVAVPAVEKLDRRELTAAYKKTGEVPSGAHVDEPHETFSIK